ncbi:c-type cytochrome [Thioalkalivibrio sulfidiphilus]|uniref:c-type cytochrome n=1 Tax=Thioalkalivibrio sulfidiphilus TaxID=1033854 RepID=UPI00036118F2|nr:c-type cytochrome [Thioalkalivibrio sulfidiphilus]
MANPQQKTDFTTKFVLAISVVVLLVAVIFLVTRLINVIDQARAPAEPSTSAQAMVEERIRPIGRVVTADVSAQAVAAPRAAADIYRGVCAACHDTGAAGAPRKGDEAEWRRRMGQGFDTVLSHSINGFGAMPARGGDPSLSDDDVRQVVVFMLSESGIRVNGAAAAPEAAPAPAAPAPAPAATAAAAAGDAAAGQAKYTSCAACHGAQGQGMGIFPKLAGTAPERIAELLKKYRAGEQVGPQTPLMAPNAAGLSDQDIADLAAFVGTL